MSGPDGGGLLRQILRIAATDAREVLRDRRALFLNLVLPTLLYPLVLLFQIQIAQLTQAQTPQPARFALVDAPGALERLATPEDQKIPAKPGEKARGAAALMQRDQSPVERVSLSAMEAAVLRQAAADNRDRDPAILAALRQRHVALAMVHGRTDDGRHRLTIYSDEADPHVEVAREFLNHASNQWRDELIVARLATVGLPPESMIPVITTTHNQAPLAEAVRTRAAGSVPMLLMLLAIMGAFHVAVDLIAGERERGTLETLLALPVRRRAIFLGKLLVVCAAAAASVSLNLLSLGGTIALLGSQLAGIGSSTVDLGGMAGVGGGALLLCAALLLPLTVALAALALALTGQAHTVKEAQTTLGPLLLVLLAASAVPLFPGTGPTWMLDLVPITGVALALKAALESTVLPWGHLVLASLANLTLAAVLVAWGARLFDDERFRYPGLIRAGWGRWRHPLAPASPIGAPEALILFAVAVAGMTLGSGLFLNGGLLNPWRHPAVTVGGPLALCIGLPVLVHLWLSGKRPATIGLGRPSGRTLLAALLILPLAICLSAGLGLAQQALVGREIMERGGDQVREILLSIRSHGGVPALLLCAALLPGLCEEMLCRGTLLQGLRPSLGPWGATIVSAFCFAALHGSPWRFVPQLVLGLLLARLVLRCGSLWPAVLIHAGHNGSLVLLELYGGSTVPDGPWLLLAALAAIVLGVTGWRMSRPAA